MCMMPAPTVGVGDLGPSVPDLGPSVPVDLPPETPAVGVGPLVPVEVPPDAPKLDLSSCPNRDVCRFPAVAREEERTGAVALAQR